jgi:bifunctional UDP-N-acetylglucosamine pyrophosphorylase/glucosamine-1-phosphate N-acetyltransferase
MTEQNRLAAVVMAGGLGTRMRSATPKHLHPLLGRRMVDWAVEAVRALEPDPLVVVCSPDTEPALAGSLDGATLAVQREARGTGDAVAAARAALSAFDGDVLVVPGDAPLLTSRLLAETLETHRRERPALTLVTVEPERPRPYGRVVRDERGRVRAIVEATDATREQLAIRELNASIYVFVASALWSALERLDTRNAQGELYLTDAISSLVDGGRAVATVRAGDANEADGVNTRAELALAAAALRDRINARHMEAGVTIVDPQSTWVDADVELEPDAVVEPFTVLRGRTRVARGAAIGPHAVLIDAVVGERAVVGPFCYVRPRTVLEAGAKAGTFVEIKNARIGEGAKVPHLSYVGDADIGADTNVGAGTVTANFPHQPGRPKGRTTIGRNVRVGVQNGFEAPVTIGDGAWIGGGSYITDDVPPDSLAIARARQVTKEGYLRAKRNDDD